MKHRIITLAAASAALMLGALAATPAIAFDDGYDNAPYVDQGWRQRGWVGYADEDYGRSGPYGYDRPDYEVGSRTIAICPPGYSLGRRGTLCWPD
jgi:hypothetical protein